MIDLDEEALAAAQMRLGTSTKVQTVNEALRRAAQAPNQEPTAHAIVALLASSDVDKDDVMENAWRGVPELE
jgi:Arc/MetJ family transcription regulator